MKTNNFTGGGKVTLEKGFDETIFNNFTGGGTIILDSDSDLNLDEDFFNAGGRRKGCKELGLKGKQLRQCAKDLKAAGYTKGGEIPESVMKKYAPQLIQQVAEQVTTDGTSSEGGSGLAGGVKRAKSAVSEMASKADTKSAGMTMPKKVAIGVGVFAFIIIVGVIIKKSMAK